MKKIGIDARFYGTKGKGLGRYVQKLIENLEKIDGHSDRQYFVFLKKDGYHDYQPQAKNFIKIQADYQWYSISEQLYYPFFLQQFKLDLMHFCHFNVPLLYHRPYIVTIHDLILFHYPTIKNTTLNRFFYYAKLLAYQMVIRSAAAKATLIIAVSEFTKKDIEKNLAESSGKIKVTLEAPSYLTKTDDEDHATKLQKYAIMKPYLLYVGNAYPHKNLKKLLQAFHQIKVEFTDLKLLLVGGSDHFYQQLEAFIEKEKIQDVVITGYVTDKELQAIYQSAVLYVFPSLYEGFGLPPLEAMANAVPVISSNRTSMPEILADAASYFNPENINSMVTAIKNGLNDETLRRQLILKGNKRLQRFSWQRMAEQTLDSYIRILKK